VLEPSGDDFHFHSASGLPDHRGVLFITHRKQGPDHALLREIRQGGLCSSALFRLGVHERLYPVAKNRAQCFSAEAALFRQTKGTQPLFPALSAKN
jgi:hypothetical protein